MSEEYDTCATDEVRCPYCGYTHEDSHEFFASGGDQRDEIECIECGKKFWATRNISVYYNSGKNAT